MGPSVAVMDHLTFTFDAQEALPMADPTKTPDSGSGSMTLEQVTKTLSDLAPQVAKLQEAFAALSAPPAAAADKDPAAADPAAAKPAATVPPAAATPDSATAAAMDAALQPLRVTVDKLAAAVATMDAAIKGIPTPAALIADVAARDKLADRLAAVVGTFDAKDKTLSQVAAYGCEKLGLKPPAGAEFVAVDSYLTAAAKAPAAIVRTGLDAAPARDSVVSKYLSGETATK